jgi:ABC-type glycerol-3-phosphate transport system substrate-binding protein
MIRSLRFSVCAVVCALGASLAMRADQVEKDGKIHVTYWEKWVSFEGVAMQATVDAFNRSQDKIVVDYYPTSQVDRKVLVATAGGDPPDVAGLWVQNIASFADAGALAPLDEFIRADGMTTEQWLARYYPTFAHICTYRGQVFAGIATPAMIALHWNKTLFRAAGLDPERPPRTVAELDEFARKLTQRDPQTGRLVQMGFLPQEPGWWPWIFARWFGGDLFDGEKITVGTDARNLEAMRWVARYTEENGRDEVRTFASGFGGQALNAQSAFMNGKVAMVFQGVWFDNYIRQYKPGLDYGVGPWPEAAAGVKDFAMAEADVLVIPRGAKNPRAAWAFIKFANSNNPNARTREELTGIELTCFLQAKSSPLRVWSPFFEQHHPHPFIGIFRELSASPHAVSVPQIGLWQEYNREFMAVFEQTRTLLAKPEDALAECQERVSASWERYKRSLKRQDQAMGAQEAKR